MPKGNTGGSFFFTGKCKINVLVIEIDSKNIPPSAVFQRAKTLLFGHPNFSPFSFSSVPSLHSFPIGLLRAWSACVTDLVCALLAASCSCPVLPWFQWRRLQLHKHCKPPTQQLDSLIPVFLFQPQNMWHAFSQDSLSADSLASMN